MTERQHRLNRRELIAVAGAAGMTLLVGCGDDEPAPKSSAGASTTAESGAGEGCVLTPELTEGPYYLDDQLLRRDITDGKTGTPLELALTVQDATSCKPIEGAIVEVWHADALGVYSGFESQGSGQGSPSAGGPPPGGSSAGDGGTGQDSGNGPSAEGTAKYLRGGQRTDAEGLATIDTIFPGWYQGRTPHIHIKVFAGGDSVHTGQLFFDDAVTKAVYARGAYASHDGQRTTNAGDNIYDSGGKQSTLELRRSGKGYVGSLTMGVNA